MSQIRLKLCSLYAFCVYALFFLGSLTVHAQEGQATLACGATSANLSLYQRVLRSKIQSSIDTATYQNIRVRVMFALVKPAASPGDFGLDEIMDGISLSQTGLSMTLSGTLGFYTECEYTYRVRVRVSATDKATGTKLKSSTDSIIKIISAGETTASKVVPPATPTPGATATVTPTPTESGGDEEA